jgi:hypothetical protein
MTTKKTKKYYTFRELANEYGKDITHIAKLIKKFDLDAVPAVSEGKACQAISNEDKSKLEKKEPLLALPKVGADEITIDELAKQRNSDTSGLLKYLKANKFEIEKRQRDGGGRPINAISLKEVARLNKENPVSKMENGDVLISELATQRGCDHSGLLKMLRRNGFKIEYKRAKEGGGALLGVLSSKEVARLNKEHPVRIKV